MVEYIKSTEYIHFLCELNENTSKELTEKCKKHIYIQALIQETYLSGSTKIHVDIAKLLFNHNLLPVRVIINGSDGIKMRGNLIDFKEWFSRYYDEVEQSTVTNQYEYQIWDTDL